MLTWHPDGSQLAAKTEMFRYVIEEAYDPDTFEWSVYACGEIKATGGPDNMVECKAQCQDDFNARLKLGQEYIDNEETLS